MPARLHTDLTVSRRRVRARSILLPTSVSSSVAREDNRHLCLCMIYHHLSSLSDDIPPFYACRLRLPSAAAAPAPRPQPQLPPPLPLPVHRCRYPTAYRSHGHGAAAP